MGSLAVNTNWELTNGLVRLPCFTSKQNTALTTSQRTWPATTTQQWCWYQFQSQTLMYPYNWTTADTVSMVLGKCAETTTSGDTHLAYIVRVVSGDGASIRGVIGLYHATSSEYPLMASAATRIHSARTDGATTFSSQAGDRIIIEIGLHGVTPAAELIQMRVGDPSGTGDFALTAGLTTDLCPWVRLSKDVVFGTPPITLTVQNTAHGHTVENPALLQTHILIVAGASHGHTVDSLLLTQNYNLLVAGGVHGHTADVVNLIENKTLIVQDVEHNHAVDNITLSSDIEDIELVIADTLHGHLAGSILLTQVHNLFVSGSVHGHSVSNITLSLPGTTKLLYWSGSQWVETSIKIYT